MTKEERIKEEGTKEEGTKQDRKERLVKVFEAPTISEALVIRGVLESVGIYSPDLDQADPFPMHEPPEGGWHSSEVWVPESLTQDARRAIAEARKSGSTGNGD